MDSVKITEYSFADQISGFHIYRLDKPFRIISVGKLFCELTGYSCDELVQEDEDRYLQIIHPADREIYLHFLEHLSVGEGTQNLEYRILCKNGETLLVKDTMSSGKTPDGIQIGVSVLTDISDTEARRRDINFVNEKIPFGFLRYTCERQPKATYINQQLKDILRFPTAQDGEIDYFELYKNNVLLMVPMEERRRFLKYLNRVYISDSPIAGDMTLLRCDGTRAHVFGWVIKTVGEDGTEEFQSACVDITERYRFRKESENKRYIKALTDVYDLIFEYDLSANTVKCLYAPDSGSFQKLEDIPMQMEDATEKWIENCVVKEDEETIRAFFKRFYQKTLFGEDERPPQITYHAKSSSGEIKRYKGIFLKTDEFISLFCCRNITGNTALEIPHAEDTDSKNNMKEMLMRFTDGIAAFEITASGFVTPLYASENVCEFFGFTKEEWLPLMGKSTPVREFIRNCEVGYDDFIELFGVGEAEFTYYDLKTKSERTIKAICSPKAADASPKYVMLYGVEKGEDKKAKALPENRAVFVRSFGYFDVFVGDQPIAFRNKKSKELFAILVDRRGGFITSEEAISYLWEDEPVTPVTLSRYRKVALRLKNTLEEYGIADIMESIDGKRRIIPEKIQCDLYDYLSGNSEYSGLFKGSYMTNYSWGENTLAELTGRIL